MEGSLLTLPLCTGYLGSLGTPHPPAVRHCESVGRPDVKQEAPFVPNRIRGDCGFQGQYSRSKITRMPSELIYFWVPFWTLQFNMRWGQNGSSNYRVHYFYGLIMFILCVSIYICLCIRFPGTGVSHLMWVLGSEPRSPTRAASAINC